MHRIVLAALHLIALGIGLGGVWSRAAVLGERPVTVATARRAFVADAWWGIAALLWVVTGLWRALASTEKATSYYTHNHVFFAKMGLFVIILALEIWPMITMGKWRAAAKKSGDSWRPDASVAARIRIISKIEAVILLAMVVAAVMMARGYGAGA